MCRFSRITNLLNWNFGPVYNFSNKYVTYPTGKYYQASKYPTLGLNYVRGINGFLSSDVRYDVLSFDFNQIRYFDGVLW